MPRPPKTKPAAQRDMRRAAIEADKDTPPDELRTPNGAVFTSSFELHPSNSAPALSTLRDTLRPKLLSRELSVAATDTKSFSVQCASKGG